MLQSLIGAPALTGAHGKAVDEWELDRNHPLAPDELCVIFGKEQLPVDHVSGARLTVGAHGDTIIPVPFYGETMMGFDVTDTNVLEYLIFPNALSHSTSQQWVLTWYGATVQTNGGTNGVFIGESGTNTDYVWMKGSSVISVNDGSQKTATGGDWHIPRWNSILFTAPGYIFFRDGIAVDTEANCSSAVFMPHLGASFNTTGFTFNGYISTVYAHGWPLSQRQIQSIHVDPYQFMRPRAKWHPGIVTAAAAVYPWWYYHR